MHHKSLLYIALFCAAGSSLLAQREPARVPATRAQAVRDAFENTPRPADADVTLWIGGPEGKALYEIDAAAVMPTASAIKTFFLVELFVAHDGQLDRPLDDAAQILKDDHPAISHFSAEVRQEIRRELQTASVRRISEIMQGKTDVSNAVYNAAANLVTAHLGGPEKLTALIHARDPRFRPVMIRRYMLRDRTEPGDNEANAEAFAALYQSLASRKLAGVSDGAMTAIHAVLKKPDPASDPVFEKDGGLGSEPLTSVRAGWQQTARGSVIFVVMCRRAVKDGTDRSKAYEQLQSLSASLRDRALGASPPSPTAKPAAAVEHTKDSLETVRANLKDKKAVLLDVRDRDEWDDGHLADAVHVPLGQLRKPNIDDLLRAIPRDKIVYTHCAAGGRALNAGRILMEKDYDVRPLPAGYDELLKNGFEKAR